MPAYDLQVIMRGLIAVVCGMATISAEIPQGEVKLHVDAAKGLTWDGIGGLSGGGATSNYIMAYDPETRKDILDLLFLPKYAGSLDILKVEIGGDDQSTDGSEACHMRNPKEVDCNRGYEWYLMKEAVARRPDITLYGLPWVFPGWLGFGTSNPFTNVTETARYISTWLQCARDTHHLNVSWVGIWNEDSWTADYVLALRSRLDKDGFGSTRITAPDGGGFSAFVKEAEKDPALLKAVASIGAHYPGAGGMTPDDLSLGLPVWSSEDYSTYSNPTGGGCWGRLLVQNAGWGFSSTISWYLVSSFARGLLYTGDGLVRAEWPSSGHYEVTPTLWYTAHWTLFMSTGSWSIMPCDPSGSFGGKCTLPHGGNYAIIAATKGPDAEAGHLTIVVESLTHDHSRCIRNDPPDWTVAPVQNVTFSLNGVHPAPQKLHVFRSCVSWLYPDASDEYLRQLPDIPVDPAGAIYLTVDRNCYYTLTTITGHGKPAIPSAPPQYAFPLPHSDTFDSYPIGDVAPFWGDQVGKFETALAAGGRTGMALEQKVVYALPINDGGPAKSQPMSIIGDLFMANGGIEVDVFLPSLADGAGVALLVREPSNFFRDTNDAGLFFWLGQAPHLATPWPLGFWALCIDSKCSKQIVNGTTVPSIEAQSWRNLRLEVMSGNATGWIDSTTVFQNICLTCAHGNNATCMASAVHTDKVLAGNDYRNFALPDPDPLKCKAACCSDGSKCHGWAMDGPSEPRCWLKSGGTLQPRQPGMREIACGLVDTSGQASLPPSSGWASLLATPLSAVQFDNVLLPKLDPVSGVSCTPAPAGPGSVVVSAPCDQEDLHRAWTVDPETHLVHLSSDHSLCLGTDQDHQQVTLVPCDAPSPIHVTFDPSTGRLMTHDLLCVDFKQSAKPGSLPAAAVSPCAELPADTQQHHFHPGTGNFRMKASNCITTYPSDLDYRDCCLGIC
eukprot:gene2387-508_t